MNPSDRPGETAGQERRRGEYAPQRIDDPSGGLAEQIARLANELFQGGAFGPGVERYPVDPVGGPHAPAPSADHLGPVVMNGGPIAPPAWGPSALSSLGAGGASPAVAMPPTPGLLQHPPVASAPPPNETDLRAIPMTVLQPFGLASPLALAVPSDPEGATPYFLRSARQPPGAPVGSPRIERGFQPALNGGSSAHPDFGPDFGFSTRLFDPHVVRRDFPILQARVHGRPLVWLDNAATTQKPQAVIDRLSYFYKHENSNVHRGAHALAARATDAYEAARDKVRRFLNAPSPKEIVFARGATEAINLVAKSWGHRHIHAGDEIVISWLEHHANIVPWQQLAAEKGARLRVIPVDDRGQINLEAYEKLLGPRTKLVSVSQVSNALGTITPAREMVEMAHRYGARIMIDGAQAVSHMRVDVQALDCDFYCFSGHKVFGPTGIGALFGKSEVLENMPGWQGGGNMIADVTFEKTTYQAAPTRFEAGTGNIADAVGLGAALDYVTALGLENVSRHEHDLLTYATRHLDRVPGLRMIGTAAEKAGVLSFVLDGQRTEEMGGALDREGIAVRSGHHCAQPILRRFGVENTIRASLAPYNTYEDIDALVAALQRLQVGRPARGL